MKYPVFDGHCDTAVEIYYADRTPFEHWKGHVTLSAMEHLPRYAQFFAFCTACLQNRFDPAVYFEECYSAFQKELSRHRDRLTLCGNTAQIEQSWETGKAAALLSVEGAEAVACDPGRLEELAQRGFRMVSLTWNYENDLAGSHVTGQGLTAKGKEFARRAQKLGMLLDVSHLSDRGFYDLCDLTEGPIIASHSNCRSLCGDTRNLTDEMISLVAQSGGTVGLNLYPLFLTGSEKATFEDLRRHLEHLCTVAGEDAVALGGDLDGIRVAPDGFESLADYEKLTEYLSSCGMTDAVLSKICAGNLQRVMNTAGSQPV